MAMAGLGKRESGDYASRGMRREVRVVEVEWRPGYGRWQGYVPAEVAVDGTGKAVCALQHFWGAGSHDRETAEQAARARVAAGTKARWIQLAEDRREYAASRTQAAVQR